MGPKPLFHDERQIDSFSIELHDGQTTLTCTVFERWDELFGRVYRCGNGETQKLVRHRGISIEERQNLEATIKGALGLSGIAELKSAITGKAARRIEFEESEELTREFSFAAPECGRLELLCYQLKRLYRFHCSDRRRWHNGSWTRTFTEWVNHIHDDTHKFLYDPYCGCKQPSPSRNEEKDLTVEILLGNRIAMRTALRSDATTFSVPELGTSFDKKDVDNILYGTFLVHRDAVPPHLLFLADETAGTITARIAPSTADRIAGSLLEQQPHYRPNSQEPAKITKQRVLFFMVGLGVGTTLAVLFSSKSGEDTREYLASKADEGKEYAQKKARELRERAEELIERSKAIMSRQKTVDPSVVLHEVGSGGESHEGTQKKTRAGRRTKRE